MASPPLQLIHAILLRYKFRCVFFSMFVDFWGLSAACGTSCKPHKVTREVFMCRPQ